MSDYVIEADAFGRTIEQLMGRLGKGVTNHTPQAVENALDKGEKAWKRNARAVLSKSYSRGGWGKVKGYEYYRSGKRKGQVKSITWYGRTYKTGKYARSIRHHMMSPGGDHPEGEIGSASLPGLPHLLEKGHATVGGGFVAGRKHIEPAAEEAFKDFEKKIDKVVSDAIDSV